MAKYTPVEKAIISARAKRLENVARRREIEARRFGDLCEATRGRAVVWRRQGTPLEDQVAWADGDVFTLVCLARYHRLRASREVDRLRHQVTRPLYYAAENARRRALAAERRRIRRRTTENPCPTRVAILEAWTQRRSSHAAAIRFGSLMEDLECYLDNSLLRDETGAIVGRRGGVKRWLQTEIPALYLLYTTVMRYKAAARKLRQITEVADPTPVARILDDKPSPPLFVLRARAIWREITLNVPPTPTALMARLDALLDPCRQETKEYLSDVRTRYTKEITVRTKSFWLRKLFDRKRSAGGAVRDG